MRFNELLSRADDETLQLLLGETPMKLILTLDPGLATPKQLRELVLQIYTAEGLLLSPEKRAVLFDFFCHKNKQSYSIRSWESKIAVSYTKI